MAPEVDGTRRLHPATLLFEVGRRFASLVLWSVTVVVFAARTEERWYLLFLLPPVIEALVRYLTFRYAFEPAQLVVRSGFLVRSVRHVPYARVQNLDTLQGPLHRLLGVVEVRLETAAGNEPEAVFRVISEAQLGELRARVLDAPRAHRTADEAFESGPFFRMRLGEVLLFGLLSQRGLVLALGAFAAVRELPFFESFRARVEQHSELAERIQPASPLAWLALLALGFVLLQLGSMAWAVLTLHGFRIERRGEDLRTTCGLLTRQTASLPRARVQLLCVREGLLQRALGRAAVRARSAGGDSTDASQVSRKWLVPLCRRAELPALLAEVQPEAEFEARQWQAVHPRAARRLFVRHGLVLELVALLGLLHSLALWLALALLALGAAALLARARARRLGYALSERAVFLRDGLLARRRACVRFDKIQSVRLARTPLDRRAGMASLVVDVAGSGALDLSFELPFLDLRVARRLARRLAHEAAAVSFRW
jgi:putative membrane protein